MYARRDVPVPPEIEYMAKAMYGGASLVVTVVILGSISGLDNCRKGHVLKYRVHTGNSVVVSRLKSGVLHYYCLAAVNHWQ